MTAFLTKTCLILFCLGVLAGIFAPTHRVHAASFTAVQDGGWNNSATWGGGIPTATDTVTIPIGISVSIGNSTSVTRSALTTVNGTLTNNGTLINDHILEIYGVLINQNVVDNINTSNINTYAGGTFTNNVTFYNSAAFWTDGTFTNAGTLWNYDSIENDGTFDNLFHLWNYGTLDTLDGTLTNNGDLYNYCGGVVTGIVTGAQPVDYPSAPAPSLLAPIHRAHTTDTTPNFDWATVSTAYSYRLMVYLEDRSFEYKKRVFVDNYTLTAGEALTPAKYLWRVRSQDAVCSTWSGWSGRYTLFLD